jgi:hypothetical protein
LYRSLLINPAGLFGILIKDAGASSIPNLDDLLMGRPQFFVDIVPHHLAGTDGKEVVFPDMALQDQRGILHLETRARMQTARSAADA